MSEEQRSTPRHTRAVVLGSAISGIAGYVFSILGVRVLGDTAYANIAVLWTIQYLVVSITLLNIEAWVTRHRGVAPWVAGWVIGLAGIVTAIGSIAAEQLFHGGDWTWGLIAGAITLAYGSLIVARGQLAANESFTAFGVLNGAEALIRLGLAIGLALLVVPPWAWGAIMPIGPIVVVLGWLGFGGRFTRADAPFPAYYLLNTTVSNGISQLLLAGAPLAVALLGAGPQVTSLVFVTTTLGRAPLVFLHGGLLARILPPLLAIAQGNDRHRIAMAMNRVLAVATASLIAAYIGGGLIGPPVVALAYGNNLRPSFVLAGFTGVAVIATMVALLLGQVLIALHAERDMAVPWIIGLVATAIGTMVIPLPMSELIVAASALGAIVATLGLSVVVRRAALTQNVLVQPERLPY
ncbi:hypothetical protein [Stomatohabitans albus]|uniref:hypothetical protein n=1 Tax=Stomatohabitans albus TaxID=3110766 RepID=UPI00300C8C75